jgi:hypothetical protein
MGESEMLDVQSFTQCLPGTVLVEMGRLDQGLEYLLAASKSFAKISQRQTPPLRPSDC